MPLSHKRIHGGFGKSRKEWGPTQVPNNQQLMKEGGGDTGRRRQEGCRVCAAFGDALDGPWRKRQVTSSTWVRASYLNN